MCVVLLFSVSFGLRNGLGVQSLFFCRIDVLLLTCPRLLPQSLSSRSEPHIQISQTPTGPGKYRSTSPAAVLSKLTSNVTAKNQCCQKEMDRNETRVELDPLYAARMLKRYILCFGFAFGVVVVVVVVLVVVVVVVVFAMRDYAMPPFAFFALQYLVLTYAIETRWSRLLSS